MKKIIWILIFFPFILEGCIGKGSQVKEVRNVVARPYEATWLEITKTDGGYVVYNYPSLWDDGKTIAPMSIAIRNDSLIWVTFHDDVGRYELKKVQIEERKDGSFFFPVGNRFLFVWYDEANHIAQWKVYGDVAKNEPLTSYLYVDSRYNKFPVIDFDWSEDNREN